MFALKRLLIFFVIAVAAYCFWPRSSSLSRFDPRRMSELQMTVWKEAAAKKKQELIFPLYEIYERQYHLPPVSSLKMAWDTARALNLFHTAPDVADQEKALLPLQTVFVTLKSNTKSTFDPAAAARMELMTWMLRADRAKRAQLTSASSELLAILYGRSTAECLPAARQFSVTAKLAEEGKWDEAGASSLQAWQEVRKLGAPEK